MTSESMPPEPPNAPFIYLATPCFGGLVNIFFLRSVLDLQAACEARGVGLHVELLSNDPLITRARSRLAARFLAHPKATHFLFVDADIGFSPAAVFRLLDCGKDVAGGVCPLKHIDWEKVRAAALSGTPAEGLMAKSVGYVVRFIPTADNSVEVEEGLARVSYVGTGFLMISRGALQRVTDAHPELTADLSAVEPGADRTVMVYDTIVDGRNGEQLSEDYAFLRRWDALGGEVWADMESRFTHVGHAAYSGSLIEAMRPG